MQLGIFVIEYILRDETVNDTQDICILIPRVEPHKSKRGVDILKITFHNITNEVLKENSHSPGEAKISGRFLAHSLCIDPP